MNETWSWDDVRRFLAVARAGGLAGATISTKVSAPTLGRRMVALERALGSILFERRRDGYDLTAAGEEFLTRAEAMEQGAVTVERWRAAKDPHPAVRIAAGPWTSAFIARHSGDLAKSDREQRIEILTGLALADLTHRQADLGIRNRRPDVVGLAGRRLGRVEFAIYAAPSLIREFPEAFDDRRFARCDWITLSSSGPSAPSADWLRQRLRRPAVLSCSAPRPVLDAALAGAGLCILPCFIGDAEPGLSRASDSVPELAHHQWLVSHDDDRHNPPIRRVAEGLSRLFRAKRQLLGGADQHVED